MITALALFAPVVRCEDEDENNDGNDADAYAYQDEDGAEAGSWLNIYHEAMFCASYNNQDQIIWSFYDQYKCKDDGQQTTMATPVADYVKNLYDSMKLENEIKQANGDEDAIDEDDFVELDETYLECYDAGDGYYYSLGCSRLSSKQLEVISFTDADCLYETVDSDGEVITTGIDVSAALYAGGYAMTFNQCNACVDMSNYADENEEYDWDEVSEDSLCTAEWDESTYCGVGSARDNVCLALGGVGTDNVWNAKDIFFLTTLVVAFFGMMVVIGKKRTAMPAKDRLLEEASAASLGLRRTHLAGIFLGTIVVVTALAASKLVQATIGFCLVVDVIAFVYLLKLTLFN